MSPTINFMGEEFAGYKIDNLCSFDPTKFHIVGFNGCAFSMKPIEDVLKEDIEGYDGTKVQFLINENGVLKRGDFPN